MSAVARVNESVSRLNRALRGHLHAEWWHRTDSDHGGHPNNWPAGALSGLMLAKSQWLREIGRIHVTYASVRSEGQWFCVLQLTYSRVNERPSISVAAAAATDGVGASALPSDAVRTFSPSLCWDDRSRPLRVHEDKAPG